MIAGAERRFESCVEVHAFLKQHNTYLNYTQADIEAPNRSVESSELPARCCSKRPSWVTAAVSSREGERADDVVHP